VMPPSKVYLQEAQWPGYALPGKSQLKLVVRGGYYVRALARDLGRLLGCGAHLTRLHRTAIGPWTDPGPQNSGKPTELHGREILPWASTRLLSDQDVGDLRQHRTIAVGQLVSRDWPMPSGFPDPQAPIRGFHRERLSFLLSHRDGGLCVLTPLRGGL